MTNQVYYLRSVASEASEFYDLKNRFVPKLMQCCVCGNAPQNCVPTRKGPQSCTICAKPVCDHCANWPLLNKERRLYCPDCTDTCSLCAQIFAGEKEISPHFVQCYHCGVFTCMANIQTVQDCEKFHACMLCMNALSKRR